MRCTNITLTLALALAASACAPATPNPAPRTTSGQPRTLTLLTHDSFAISQAALQAFEQAHNATVLVLAGGDTGSTLNKALLSREAPLADVLYGVDNTFLSRALDNDLFIPYASPALAAIPNEFELDPQNRALPVNFGDVCLNYDVAYFAERGLNPPQTLADLTHPDYRGLLVVQNPASSSPGLAFLLATIASQGEAWPAYWQALKDNAVLVVDDWETAYYTEFSGSSGRGPRPLVVSYASSPPAEVMFADPKPATAPTANLPRTCFRQIEFVGILTGTANLDLAQAWVDFMLSDTFQSQVAEQMFVFPVLPGAGVPPEFIQFAPLPASPFTLPPERIAAERETWIQQWADLMLP